MIQRAQKFYEMKKRRKHQQSNIKWEIIKLFVFPWHFFPNKISGRRWEHSAQLGKAPARRLGWWFNQDTHRWKGKGPSCTHANLQMHCRFAFPETGIGGVQKYLVDARSILSIFPRARLINLKYMEKDRVLNWESKELNILCQHNSHLASFLCASPFTHSSLMSSISKRMRRYHWVCSMSWQQMVRLRPAFYGRNFMPHAESPGSLPWSHAREHSALI